jgi:flagellar hook-length control protein FliK
MHLSPHTEIVPDVRAYADIAPPPAGIYIPGGESPEILKDQPAADDPAGHGEFAEILADLLRETGINNAEAAAEGVAIPLADMTGAVPKEASEDDASDSGLAAGRTGRGKNPWPGKAAAADEPGKAEKSGSFEAELSGIDFSEEDKNILLGVELLLNRSAEQNAPTEEETALSGEIHLDAEGCAEAADMAGLFAGQIENAETAAEMPAEAAAESAKLAGENPQTKRLSGGAEDTVQDANSAGTAGELAALDPGAERLEQAGQRKNNAEKEGRSGYNRLEEARSRDKRRASLEVRDLRTGNGQSAESALKSGGVRVDANTETRLQTDTEIREISLELRLPNQGQNAPNAETAWELKSGQAFEDLLARELHQNFNNDIVRHASMVLRDEGAGTIRLALKPETLGNVKIRLEMAENKITGLIVVESEEALRAFEREVHSLEQAFKESGFEAANLEMSLAGDGGGAEQNWREAEASPFFSERLSAAQYDAALERAEMSLPAVVDVYQRSLSSINVLA